MTDQLYRITCLSSHELGEYYLGLLPPDKEAAAAHHLAECPHCASEIVQLQEYLEALEPDLEFSLRERVKVWVARLVDATQLDFPEPGFFGPSPSPAYAGTRGQEDELHIYQANDVQIAIEVQDDAEQPEHKTLIGLITGSKAPCRFKAHLWRASQCVATVMVDELGNLAIPGLEPDTYELILSGPGQAGAEVEIHIQNLQVRPVPGGINQKQA
jgi:hypothetical protein